MRYITQTTRVSASLLVVTMLFNDGFFFLKGVA